MSRPLTDAELDAFDRAAAIGFHRERPPLPEPLANGDGLALAAYAAQQRRLTTMPPRNPGGVEAWTAPADPRPILPDAARAGLRRLVAAVGQHRAHELLVPVARVVRERGWRLHPFDTDAIRPLQVAAGPYERWIAELAGISLDDDTVAPDVADDAWTRLTPGARAAWLSRRRYADPDAARALLEATWSSEKAEVRARLLVALRVRLGAADRPFLAGLDKDRSAKVKELAKELLARAPTGDGDARAVVTAGLVARRVMMIGPKRLSVVSGTDLEALFTALSELPPDDSFGLVGVDEGAAIASGGDLVGLLPALALGALRAGDADRHARLVRAALEAGWDPNGSPWLDQLGEVPRDVRRAALDPLLPALVPAMLATVSALDAWMTLLDGPLTPEASAALRRAPAWTELLAALRDPDRAAAADGAIRRFAPLVHPRDAKAAAEALAAAGPMAAPLVRMLWLLLHDLESAP